MLSEPQPGCDWSRNCPDCGGMEINSLTYLAVTDSGAGVNHESGLFLFKPQCDENTSELCV